MNDFKLIAKSEEELQNQIQTFKTFNDNIHMEFGLDKFAKFTFKKGKLTYLLTPWSRVLLEKLISELCS
jgi:hypothetical protein